MDFTFEDQQLALRDAIHKFLMVEAAPEMLRDIWETVDTTIPVVHSRIESF